MLEHGQDVDLQIDLGQPQTVSVFRAHLFGYDSWDALKGQVKDRVEILTSADGVNFASQGVMPLSLWKKDIPINHMLQDDGKATGWNFEVQAAGAGVDPARAVSHDPEADPLRERAPGLRFGSTTRRSTSASRCPARRRRNGYAAGGDADGARQRNDRRRSGGTGGGGHR